MQAPEASDMEYEGRDLEAMGFAINYHRWIRDEFAPFLSGDVAEVGAGDGEFSRMLLECDPSSLVLFEPSKNMFERQGPKLERHPNLERHCSTFGPYAVMNPQRFSAICYVNVMEHVEQDDLELKLAYDALRPGGRLLLFVPALAFLMSSFDRAVGHHRRYHRAELVKLVGDAGFSIERCHYFDVAGVLPWLVVMRWWGGGLNRKGVNAYDRFVVPIMRRVERTLRPPIGKNLLLIARKPG